MLSPYHLRIYFFDKEEETEENYIARIINDLNMGCDRLRVLVLICDLEIGQDDKGNRRPFIECYMLSMK